MMLTYDRLREVLNYDKETGEFTWRMQLSPKSPVGTIAGGYDVEGYLIIQIDGVRYKAHRLAWVYEYGHMPENDIDHIDRDKKNNKLKNLREVSKSCNSRNRNISKNNVSGVTGVSWSPYYNKWIASLQVNRKYKNLGKYDNLLDAAKARWEAEKEYKYPDCDSQSSALQYIKENS